MLLTKTMESEAGMRVIKLLSLVAVSGFVAGLVVLLGLIVLAPGVLSRGLECWEPPRPADALVVVDGGYPFRSLSALDLYLEGSAPVVVMPTDTELRNVRHLHRTKSQYGSVLAATVRCYRQPFPASAIRVWGNTTHNTVDELRALSRYLKETGFSRVVLVTSDYHARRTGMLFGGLTENIEFTVVATPYSGILKGNRWRDHPHKIKLVLGEYAKIAVQWVGIQLSLY